MNYRELYKVLSNYTEGFCVDSGKFPVGTRADLNNAKEILSRYYNDVTSNLDYENEGINGTDYQVSFGGLIYLPDKNPSVGPLGEALEKHDELNPDLWDDNELKLEVREKIEEIADKFKENLAEDEINIDIEDIVIVGSNANYNYTEHSDIDVHIIADTSIYENQEELAVKLYEAYKRLFNNKYDPTIYCHEVEIYVEPNEIHANSNGIYSFKDGWIKEPEKLDIPDLDETKLNELVTEYENKIEQADTIAKIDDVVDSLYILRQESILKDGEFSLGNQVFKEIRNMGLLQNLKDKKVELENQELSLGDNYDESLLEY